MANKIRCWNDDLGSLKKSSIRSSNENLGRKRTFGLPTILPSGEFLEIRHNPRRSKDG